MNYYLSKKNYSFVNENKQKLEGINYYLNVETEYGTIQLKINATGFEKNILEKLIEERKNNKK